MVAARGVPGGRREDRRVRESEVQQEKRPPKSASIKSRIFLACPNSYFPEESNALALSVRRENCPKRQLRCGWVFPVTAIGQQRD